jgi:salicylate 1-O-methyltransferase
MDHKITSDTIQNAFLLFITKEKLPKLLKAISEEEINSEKPFVISDYGCAGGKTTFILCDDIVRYVHSKNPEKIIKIYLNDLPQNDFRLTFKEALEHYSQSEKVFIFAIGKSFYSQVLPPKKVNIVLSCYSVHWLEKCPSPLQNDLIGSRNLTDYKEKKIWTEQASKDLKKFFELRSKELVPGGHLFIAIPGMKGHGVI